jgi:hypothetical protein
MPEYISRQILKKKALERWENEGGRIFADRTEIIKDDSPDERAGKDNAARSSEDPAAERFKMKENKR